MKPEILYEVKAQRGDILRCKGWKQETLLRMLENNMENAEAPEYLVIYGGIGKCARNWESYHAIVDSLKTMETGFFGEQALLSPEAFYFANTTQPGPRKSVPLGRFSNGN